MMLDGLSRALFRLLIGLHPHAYRDEFGAEMQTVFEAKMHDALRTGVLSVVRACIHELAGLLQNLLVEHWRSLKGEPSMSGMRRFHTLSLFLPLGLLAAILAANPRFMLRLFTSSLGWIIALTFVLAILFVVLTLQPRLGTTGKTALAGPLSLLAIGCILFGPPLVMLVDFDPGLGWLQVAGLVALALIDLAIIAAIAVNTDKMREQV